MVLTGTHNLCFEQKYEKYQNFLFENFQFLEVEFSIYLNRRVFVMCYDNDNFIDRRGNRTGLLAYGRVFDYLTMGFLHLPGSSVRDVSPTHLSVSICREHQCLTFRSSY